MTRDEVIAAVSRGISLREADLVGHEQIRIAQHRSAQISLCGADLRGADVRRANLLGADFSRADLHGAEVRYSDLYAADLAKTIFGPELTICALEDYPV